MNPPPPMGKIEMIERSMRCFAFGLAALIPVLGIPFAIVSLNQFHRVKRSQTAMWNPAQRYLFWGAMCARAGLWPILIAAVVYCAAVLFFGLG